MPRNHSKTTDKCSLFSAIKSALSQFRLATVEGWICYEYFRHVWPLWNFNMTLSVGRLKLHRDKVICTSDALLHFISFPRLYLLHPARMHWTNTNTNTSVITCFSQHNFYFSFVLWFTRFRGLPLRATNNTLNCTFSPFHLHHILDSTVRWLSQNATVERC